MEVDNRGQVAEESLLCVGVQTCDGRAVGEKEWDDRGKGGRERVMMEGSARGRERGRDRWGSEIGEEK